MAGTDQSVNLSGMLGDIAKTTGGMGDAFKPVLQAATKPRGDMSDPNHLRNLAQWASRNGDATMSANYMAEARQITAKQEQAAKEKRAAQGSAAMGNIQKGMQDVLAKGGPDAEKRMAALEEAALRTAESYQMDGQAAARMGDQARMGQMQVEAAERNKQIQERALGDQEVTDQLDAIRAGGGTLEEQNKQIDAIVKRAGATGKGAGAARSWQQADLAYTNAVREANEAAVSSGPLSETEKETAKEMGISVEGAPPSTIRNAIRSVQVSRASQKRDKSKAKPVEKSIIRELLPQAMGDAESGNFWGTDLDDWLEDAVDDPELMDRIAAFIQAGGTVEQGPQAYNQLIEGIKDYVVATNSGDVWFGSSAKEEILEERGVKTVTAGDGETVTIKTKED